MTVGNRSAVGKPSITPYTRPVIHTVDGQPKESEFERVRVVSYNILAQCYCRSSIFHWSDRGDIRWKRRKGKITKEIEEYNADFLLLQELDNFSEYHRGALRRLGYDGHTYVQRKSIDVHKEDGVGIFWKSEDFKVVSETPVHFNAIAEQPYGVDYAQKKSNPKHLLRDSVGAITVLQSKKHPSDVGIILATCHLFWNPVHADVKLLQAFHMVEQIREVMSEYDYPLILGGSVPSNDPDLHDMSSEVLEMISKGGMKLQNMYQYEEGDMTNYTEPFVDVLDYIFVKGGVRASSFLKLPSAKELEKNGVKGFPHGPWPSDHIALVADLEIPFLSKPMQKS
ncbi:hypothetical protein NDN08_005205 [Rhodosorus marinus]|uniref:Endonuclease/exonuclease/phosphatase domain-containing protein n=1 Tax=Rhodosorus marinus TaxID=101924 RepID=A0AAV8V469_9RHOD|nr:hypothetical protein NDN08_005205 [Rhodosorus marinus]